jgi:hypothetical protein
MGDCAMNDTCETCKDYDDGVCKDRSGPFYGELVEKDFCCPWRQPCTSAKME